MSDLSVNELLDRWVAEGLIQAEQAARIRAAEAVRDSARPPGAATTATTASPPPPSPSSAPADAPAEPARPAPPHRSLVVEALGYLGGLLAVIAGVLAAAELWSGITPAAELVFAIVGTLVLLGAGALVKADRDDALRRLREVLWLLSTACAFAVPAVPAAQMWHWEGQSVALFGASVATCYGLVLWRRTRGVLQQLAVFVCVALAVGSAIAHVDIDDDPWAPGIGVWLLSALWASLALRGHVRPRTAALLFAAAGLVVGSQMAMSQPAGDVLALLTVVAFMVGGIRLRAVWLLGFGAIEVITTVPQTASRYLPDSLAAPISIFAVGLTLLGSAIWLATRDRKHGDGPRQNTTRP